MKYKAVLFDFDGTLADTMANHYRCWKQVFKEHGIEVKETEYYPMEGASLHKIAVHFSGLDEENFINALVKKKNNCMLICIDSLLSIFILRLKLSLKSSPKNSLLRSLQQAMRISYAQPYRKFS